jgi:predicted helicase
MPPLTDYLDKIEEALAQGNATEHTHRPALKALIEAFAPGVIATNEPKRIQCGAPDFILTRNGVPLGYIEAKDVGVSLDQAERSDQLRRYRENLGNLVLTDYLEFRWYQFGEPRLTTRLARWSPGTKKTVPVSDGPEQVAALLRAFLQSEAPIIGRPGELAERMAGPARQIRDMTVAAFNTGAASSLIRDLRRAFEETLIPDLAVPDFADMFAQTLAYGLFAARVNHEEGKGPFERLSAAIEIPRTNPFLRRLFATVTGPDLDDEPFVDFVNDLTHLLARADMASVLAEFGRRAHQEDPVVHFYETFLGEYDPKKRKARGVYYTPEPVVSYIVRSIDALLKSPAFNCTDGLADTSTISYDRAGAQGKPQAATSPRVLLLDPACGTGTFLYAVVDLIRSRFMSAGQTGAWSSYVRDHLLPRLFGFEILMAPYAVAHMKLGMQLAAQDMPAAQRAAWAYDFSVTDRLHVYLTNSLEEGIKRSQLLLGSFISEEANAAAEIKRDLPIMVVLGNPPYANFGHMNRGRWILDLLEDYKKGLDEKKLNLDDDFIKFIRFGQWRINRTGAGILAFVTNHTYLDGITHRRMRESLMETFDEIYVLDLHGNVRRRERAPDGAEDENVFDGIQQGVAIALFVKKPEKHEGCIVRHAELWGDRESKYARLLENDVVTTDWKELEFVNDLSCLGSFHFYTPRPFTNIDEYCEGWSVKDIFAVQQNGIKTDRDDLFFDFDRETLAKRMQTFYSEAGLERTFRETFRVEDSSSYDLLARRQKTVYDPTYIRQCLYRPFDIRWLYYAPGLTSRPAFDVMRHMLTGKNVALVGMRQYAYDVPDYCYAFAANSITECRVFISNRGIANVFPLYLYPDGRFPESLFDHENGRRPNLSDRFIAEFAARLGMTFVPDGRGNRTATFGPEDVFAYMYAVFHAPAYRARFAELLRIDYPRLPLTRSADLFRTLCALGDELVGLHLMEKRAPLITRYPFKGDNVVESVRYVPTSLPPYEGGTQGGGRVYINGAQCFEGVPKDVWEFHVGGYRVCDKWLKDRKGRRLDYNDLTHYQQVIAALSETLRLMVTIDDTIEQCGGWPVA